MNDPLLMGGFETLNDLARNRDGLIQRNRSACEAISKRRSFHE